MKTDVGGLVYLGGAMYDRFKWLVGNFSAVEMSSIGYSSSLVASLNFEEAFPRGFVVVCFQFFSRAKHTAGSQRMSIVG